MYLPMQEIQITIRVYQVIYQCQKQLHINMVSAISKHSYDDVKAITTRVSSDMYVIECTCLHFQDVAHYGLLWQTCNYTISMCSSCLALFIRVFAKANLHSPHHVNIGIKVVLVKHTSSSI